MFPRLRVGGGAALIGLPLAAFLVGACGKALGLDDYTVSDGARHEYTERFGGISYKLESCRDCVVGSCQTEAKACSFDQGCTAMVQCLARCDPTDHGCRGICNLSVVLSSGSEAFTDLVQCEAKNGCGTCASARAVRHNESCDKCFADKCSSEIDDFSKDKAALQLDTCGCTGDAIGDGRSFFVSGERCECEETYGASGKASWDRVMECEAGPCKRECDLMSAGDWSCLEHQQVPPPPPSMDVGFTLIDLAPGAAPLPDFVVSACSEVDPYCEKPLGVRGRTDKSGQVHLSVPTDQSQAPFGYFLAEPDQDKYHDAYPRELRYIGPVRYSSYTTRDSYYAVWWIGSRASNRATSMTLPEENRSTILPDGGSDRTRGTLILWLLSCYGDAPGVALSGLDIPGLPHSPWGFFRNGSIDVTVDQTANNIFGVGLAVSGDVPPQHYNVKASLAKDGKVVGTYGVLAQEDTVTLLTVGPTPP